MKLKVGDRAPDFALPSQSGEVVSLKDFTGRRSVILYFYPKDFTVGCTVETKSFRDNYEEFRNVGAEIIGISSDTVESHKNFASECKAPFPLLSDEGGKVRGLYSVGATLGLIPGRVTFIVDEDGVVRHIFSSQFNPKKHIRRAMEILRSISKG